MHELNYHHLRYFWVVAQAGGMARAAARLGVTVQTVSAQVRELERALGRSLLRPAGRGLTLTEAGVAALRQADQIFALGAALPERVRDAPESPVVRLAVGCSQGLAKLVVRHYMSPVLEVESVRLLFREDEFDDLLAALALHRLDVVLADRPAPQNPNLKLYSHILGTSQLAWYAPRALATALRRGFPASLASAPMLLPSQQAAVRPRLDLWLERHGIVPRVVGEFDDSALLKTFAAGGMGIFAADELVHAELVARYRVTRVGACDGVTDFCYAIGTERKVHHPLVARLLARDAVPPS
jgi:LysR family transcriptional activator of nhaA